MSVQAQRNYEKQIENANRMFIVLGEQNEFITIIYGVSTLKKELERLIEQEQIHEDDNFEVWELKRPLDIDYKLIKKISIEVIVKEK